MTTRPTRPTLLLAGGAGDMPLSVDVAEQALLQARGRGLRTHVTNHADTLAATGSVTAAADAAHAADFDPPSATVDFASARAAAGDPYDVVIGVREMAQVAVADTADALGLPGNPPHAVRRVRAKDACRAALAEAGFPQPVWHLCADRDEAAAFLAVSAGPWVVKPRDAMGSEGVSLITGEAGLPRAIQALEGQRPFLVEEFVEGDEFSVEGIFRDGRPTVLAITAKEKLPPPYFVEVGHVLPAPLDERVRDRITTQVTSALLALDLRFGLFHVELWLTARGVVLGEVHVRNGGGWIHRMLAHAIPGLEMFGLVIDDALGQGDSTAVLTPVRAAATRFLTPPPGRLVRVEGFDAVRDHPAVLHAELTAKPGDVIRPMRSADDRVGAVVVGADDPHEARELAAHLAASVRFVTVPDTYGTLPAAPRPRTADLQEAGR
ncbi:ATP-grasp domain-containing protein [Streptomyces sp. NPDC051956]|uniref:ATP-grasp domain-containing protein n=1 Tax=Streptomyces sp. NPDC051956 TaxID=3365677 RepID=UPI0037CEE1D5